MTGKAWRLAVLVAASLLAGTPALAGPGSRVRIGPFVKKTVGVVKSITNGDAGCYYELRDASGATFTETAEFELCDPKKKKRYIGRKVSLTYAIEKVMADDCEGAPDCPRHKKEAIIKRVRVLN